MPLSIYSIKTMLNSNPQWKSRIHTLLFTHRGRPRWWTKKLVNPWFFHQGKHAWIRKHCILNVSPINAFQLGAKSGIEEFCVIDNGVGPVIIGEDTLIGLRNTLIGPVQIGNHVVTAQNVVMSGLNHCFDDCSRLIREQGVITASIVIADDVWIGANASILAGVHIGMHSVVGAGSVVTKDVPPYSVVAGNPAQVIKFTH